MKTGRHYGLWIALLFSMATARPMYAQALSTTSNALDRINFGDTSADATSESKHGFVNLGNPTGVGALGLTYREIAPSSVTANIGNAADNEVLTFTMACNPSLQNYLTIQIWGADTTFDVIYLYNATQGYELSNYYSTNEPEIDFQESDPILPGRFVYETIPIPLSMTTGQTSVTLTLNAANSYGYYSSGTTNLAAGQTSRPIYAAFTHTEPYLILNSSDQQGTAPSATAATPATYNNAYFSSIISSLSKYVSAAESDQVFGSSWTTAVNAGKVPAQIIGYFDTGKSPTNSYTTAQWLNNAAVDTSAGNNVAMERLDMLSFAYVTPNFLTSFYQNNSTEQAIVGALDAYSYMQALNGCWGDMTAWDGLGATTATTSNPQGRTNAQCSPIEGAGTWALGSAIVQMKNDTSFLAALNQLISSTLEPGVLRYQAYQTMLVNHINFLTGSIGHGHAPNQDLLQAKAYVYANLALRALDAIYGTSLAQSNATMYSNYLNETAGLATEQYGGIWISNGGLGLEVNGTGNGSFDGGYGWNDAYDLVWLAKILNDNGIETNGSHPVRTVAINAVHAFSNFIYPSLVISGSGYANTIREEETLTFRKNLNIGEINAGAFYYAAVDFSDPYAIHGFYLEHANGIIQPMNEAGPWNDLPSVGSGNADDNAVQYLHGYADYVTLCNMVNSQPTDTTGVTFLNETSHADGVWADPTGSTITIKHNGEKLAMVLNWRPLQVPGQDNKPSASAEVVNNLARIHDTTATLDRIATIMMPSSTATDASGSYTSGGYGTLYVGRYGNYLVGLNWQTTSATMTLAPDMTSGTATDLISGTNYNLATTNSVAVPAGGAVALYQSLPTATLGTSSLTYASTPVFSSAATQSVSLSNTGSGPLLINTVSISGPDAADFSYTGNCGSTLAQNASCSFTVTFTPQATGSRTATLYISTCLSSTAQTITLSGTGSTGTTATTLSASAATLTYGTTTTIYATVSGAGTAPTGSVAFYDSGASLGSASLNGGVASLGPLILTAGTHSITATYGGVAPYAGSTSAAFTITVNPATPSLTWTTPSTITYGTALSATQLDASSIVAGKFSYTPILNTVLSAGTQTLSITFTPTDTTDYTTATATVSLTVNKAPLTVTVNNQSMTYGSTVPSLTGTLTGVISGDGITATYSTTGTSSSTVGTYPITATLNDPNSKLSNYTVANTPGTFTITQASPTLTWITPSPITYGTPLSATQLDATTTVAGKYTYSPALGTVFSAGAQTLSVIFTPTDTTDYTTATTTSSLTVNKAPLTITVNNQSMTYGSTVPSLTGTLTGVISGDGITATYSTTGTSSSTVGTYPITAMLNDPNSKLSNYSIANTPGTLAITQATPPLTWVPAAPITYGTALSSAQLDAGASIAGKYTYNPALGAILSAGTQTLTVTFFPTDTTDYTSATANVLLTINKAPLSVTANNATRPYGTSNPSFSGSITGAVNGDSFTEGFTTAATITSAPAAYSIVPSASGTDIADYNVTAINGTLTITQAGTTTTVISSALNSVAGQSVTFTASVSPTTSGTPTGSISFYDGATLLGPGTLVSASIWSLSTSTLAVGTHSITAQYTGDANFNASVSTAISETIAAPLLTLSTSPAPVSLAAGGSASVVLTLTPLSGFNGTVTLSCASPQTFITCSLPSSASVGTSPTNVNVSISVAANLARNRPPLSSQPRFIQEAGLAVLSCSFLLFYRRRFPPTVICVLLSVATLISLAAISGCGGGSGNTNAPALPPAGSYTLTLSGTNSSLSQPSTTTITVVVTN